MTNASLNSISGASAAFCVRRRTPLRAAKRTRARDANLPNTWITLPKRFASELSKIPTRRSSGLSGEANAASITLGNLDGGRSLPELELDQSLVFVFLIADVLADHGLIAACRGHHRSP